MILAFIIVAVIVILVVVLLMRSSHPKSPYAPVSATVGFSGISIQKLAQPKEFYIKHAPQTLMYLTRVYPAGKESLAKLDPLLLASFYNSLTFYYNVQFQYNGTNLGDGGGRVFTKWSPLSTNPDNFLPYPPQGVFFNFYTYQTQNIPYVYSDSSASTSLDLKNFGSCRPGLTFTTFRGGQEGGARTGPGAQWINCRTLERHTWEPNGPTNSNNKWTIPFPGKQAIKWNYPMDWRQGLPSKSYIEVTHFYYGPGGITTSPGFWYNAFAGTGLFLSLGKTFRTTTKMGAVLDLAKELAQTNAGRKQLMKFFKTVDPYEITFGFWGYQGYPPNGVVYCADSIGNCHGYDGIDPEKGVLGETGTKWINKFYDAVVAYQKRKGETSDKPTKRGIEMAIDASVDLLDYNLWKFSTNLAGDEALFFLGVLAGYDTLQLPLDPNSDGYFVFEVVDLRVPPKYQKALKVRDYSQMINIVKRGAGFSNPWNNDFVQDSLKYIYDKDIITVRDPLDLYNDKKAMKCKGMLEQGQCPNNIEPNQKHSWFNMYCSQNILSDIYKCVNLGVDANNSGCRGGTCDIRIH